MVSKVWATAVVGGGPAGATAALHLADRGHETVLIDRSGFPRDKACGDGLIPDALNALRRAGVYDEVARRGFPSREAAIFSPGRHEFRIRGEFIVLKRLVLDDIIFRAAIARGAVHRRGRVTALQPENGAVRLQLATGDDLFARFVVVATGADVSLLRPLGTVRESEPSAVAIRRYVRSEHRLDCLVVSYDSSIVPGYAWIFPVAEDEYNVGCGVAYRRKDARNVDLREALERFLAGFPLARELVRGERERGPVRGARLRCGLGGVASVTASRILAVGETLATTFPFSGEGIGKAMETGELAAKAIGEALESGEPWRAETYRERVEALRPKYVGYELAERWLASPALNDLLARRAARSRYMRRALSGILDETVDPAEVFSFRGVLRSLVS